MLGALPIDFPVILAPMAGYTDWPTRALARRLGAGYTICEVLLDRFVVDVARGRKARRYLRVDAEDQPTAAQIMGDSPSLMAQAAATLVKMGFASIDLNFACPVKKVVGKHRGGYLLSRPTIALEMVDRVRDVLPPGIPLTVKLRRGFDDSSESRDNFYRIFDGAFQRGVAGAIVHARTVRQRYAGRSCWDFLAEIKRHAPDRILLGSGDLFSAAACLEMMRTTGVDGVTVARGAIGNPWIFQQARALAEGRPLPSPPSLFEQREVIAEHYRLAEETYGANRRCAVMRKVGIKYSCLHPNREEVRKAFVSVRRAGQWKEVLERWYATDAPGVYPEDA